MITLLAHSMMMFYLIGKGKAVKDAMAEGSLTRRLTTAASPLARKPVFSIGDAGDGGDDGRGASSARASTRACCRRSCTRMIAYGAIACNLAAVKIEIDALSESSRVVDEVNRLLGS